MNYTLKELKQSIDKKIKLEVLVKNLEIRTYIPIQEMKQEIEKLIDEILIKQGRMYTYNSIDKFVTLMNGFMYLYIENLYHSENDKYTDYDILAETGLLDYIVQNLMPKQYEEFCTFFDLVLDEKIQMNNNFEVVLAKVIDEIGEKGISLLSQTDDFIEAIKDIVNDIDQETLTTLLASISGILK